MNVGQVIAAARKQMTPKMSQGQCAELIGVERKTWGRIEQGDPAVAKGIYDKAAELTGCSWVLSLLTNPAESGQVISLRYLTGITALNIPIAGHAALWHSHGLSDQSAWHIHGFNFTGAQSLLGVVGLYDCGKSLERLGMIFPVPIYAASYERAVIDLLYYQCVYRNRPMVGVYPDEIEDVIDWQKVESLLASVIPFISGEAFGFISTWLKRVTVYEFSFLNTKAGSTSGHHAVDLPPAKNQRETFGA